MDILNEALTPRPGDGVGNLDHYDIMVPKVPLPLGDVIYPYRYDVVARACLMDYLREFEHIWNEDRREFINKLDQDTIYLEAHLLVQRRWSRWMAEEDRSGYVQMEAELEKSYNLLHKVSADNWKDGSYIIILMPENLRRAVNLQRCENDVYLEDGQHRVSTLLEQGVKELRSDQFRYKLLDEYSPFVSSDVFEWGGYLPSNFKELAYGLDPIEPSYILR